MVDIKNKNELDVLFTNYDKVLLKIGTSCCGPCKITEDNMKKLEENYPDVAFAVIDADNADEEFIDSFNIRNVPTCIVYNNGERTNTVNGLQTIEKIIELLK